MSEALLTREFSVCLLPSDDVARDIEAIRKSLPESPYRDDIPHITLLRGITAPSEMSDNELTSDIDQALLLSDKLPLTGIARAITNKGNQFYSSSGLILLDAPLGLLTLRKNVATQLKQHSYTVETQELDRFTPHVTVRLGVPLEGDMLQRTEELFLNRTITFSRWLLFRLIEEDGRRTMHQTWPR